MGTRTLTGRVVFRQAGPSRPLHHLALDVEARHLLGASKAHAVTDLDGRFSVTLDGVGDKVRVVVFDTRHRYAADGAPIDEREEVAHVDVEVPASGDLGEIAVGFWPYRADFPVPRAAPVDGKLPQSYSHGFERILVASFARTMPAKALLEGIALLGDGPSVDTIQKHQPKSLTLEVDEETPGRTRTDAWLGDQLLNGFHVVLRVGRDVEDATRLRARIVWGDMPARTDGADFDLTDVDVMLVDKGATVEPVRIALRVRTPRDGAWVADTSRVYTPEDAGWEAAKRVVRCQYLLQGALDAHITRAHFQTEAVCVATFRNLRKSPIRRLLYPHLQEIVPQGKDGDNFAWGPEGILHHQSALTLSVMHERMARLTAGWCWSTFEPRAPLHPTHRFAYAANRYWEMAEAYVRDFVASHRADIEAAWPEIRRFSDDLVAHSPVYRPFPADPFVVPADRNEEDHPEIPRPVVDGVTRSVRPVTTTDAPAPGDLDRLVHFCTYVLYTATFLHGWTHDGQYGAGGELRYATFGLRNGSMGAEDDPAVLPPPKVMMEGISTNSVGIHANYGYVLADEEHDVPPRLKALLAANRAAFAELGVNVDHIRSRINI